MPHCLQAPAGRGKSETPIVTDTRSDVNQFFA
jgi:hypothetical protein